LHRIEEGLHFTPEDHPDVIAEQLSLLLEEVSNKGNGIPESNV
jgi:hypothetical protein